MDADPQVDLAAAGIAAAIGEPARARMLFSLLDRHARTATELAAIAGVTPSTASVHLNRLKSERLVNVALQGRHRYFTLAGPAVAHVLEGLNVLAGGASQKFVSATPRHLRAARTCYDHIAGALGVALHDHLRTDGWLTSSYEVSPKGSRAFQILGVDVEAARQMRRRFAFPCLDWSERRDHLAGAVGAVLLDLIVRRKWVIRELDSRALSLTPHGRREMRRHFDLPQEL
jgi:DNA-binding transcriptional ArsR family regulator